MEIYHMEIRKKSIVVLVQYFVNKKEHIATADSQSLNAIFKTVWFDWP